MGRPLNLHPSTNEGKTKPLTDRRAGGRRVRAADAIRSISSRQREGGAFYTPSKIAATMARLLDLKTPAVVVDPACGRGDLLVAVAERYRAHDIQFVGLDIDPEAIEECARVLNEHNIHATLHVQEFFSFDMSRLNGGRERIFVVMNPPFKGYGTLSKSRRESLRRAVPSLRGRFNLAHAFLTRIVEELEPDAVVALLPGNWPRAAYNNCKALLRAGNNSWRFLPEAVFRSATTTTGIMAVREPAIVVDRGPERRKNIPSIGLAVKQGIATGADLVFIHAARPRPPSGRVVRAVRGRDVAKGAETESLPRIWIPPRRRTRSLMRSIAALPEPDRRVLANRYCVRRLGRPLWSLHETMPDWFLGAPKLIMAEICTRISILPDPRGILLPLHSTIAVHLENADEAAHITALLKSESSWRRFRRQCPRMVNDAIRVTVPVLRSFLDEHVKPKRD